jgi:L-asparaginase
VRALRAALRDTALTVACAGALIATSPEPTRAQALPRVRVIATGGTIAGQAQGGQLTGEQLVAAVPELAEVAVIEVEEFSRVGSSAMTPDHWLRLSRRVNALLRDDPALAGIVVTHGTDTMEETAYFLHLTVTDPRPVVLVGSMRVSSAVSADGPANLLSAIRVAVDPEARAKGAMVVLNDEIHSARDVRKMDNNRVDTFVSAEWGALGVVDADGVFFRRAVATKHATGSELHVEDAVESLPTVPIVIDYAGSDAAALRALDPSSVEGVVVQAFGGGRASPRVREAVGALTAAGVPVVYASRVPEGRVMGSADAVERGILSSGDLPPHKARVLLMLALLEDRSPAELQRLLATH